MRNLSLIFTLTSLITLPVNAGESRPKWVTDGSLSDSTYHYVICSHDGLDPEDVKQIAENKCLASAAKLGQVEVTVTQKTVQSLTGSDSAEVAEIKPLNRILSCEWLNRYVEKVDSGIRVWLRCRISKKAVQEFRVNDSAPLLRPNEQIKKEKPLKYKRAILNIATVPTADRLIILNQNGERVVVEIKANVQSIELKEGDKAIVLKKQRYLDEKIDLGSWENGDSISKTIFLKADI